MNRNYFILSLFLGGLFIVCFNFCKTSHPDTKESYLNLQDSVHYVGMATCRSCHNDVHQTYSQTGMGRSFHVATREKSNAIFDEHALVYDSLNDFYYFPYFNQEQELMLDEFRLLKGDTIHKRTEKIDYIVGSGQHTNSHIIDINGYVYQAPITWYTQENRWDMAPGFRQNNSRFDRWLTDECITCHNHFPDQVPGSLNKFDSMPTGIECERCHGPGAIHVKEKLAGHLVDTSTTIDYTIINPKDLPRDRQLDICQRCHLQGVAITEPGHSFFDFKPGMALNSVINVFLPRFTDSHDKFIMASQADRLRLSACFKNDETLTCLSCHHPHHSVASTPREQYNNACLNCHSKASANGRCTAPMEERKAENDDCSLCHMPKSGSIDIPHVNITDHLITSPNRRAVDTKNRDKSFLGIEILTKEQPTPIDMARGYLATYDKYIAAPIMLDSAAYYLQKAQTNNPQYFPVLIHLLFAQNDFEQIVFESNKTPLSEQPDAWTAYRIGEAFLKTGDAKKALIHFSAAVEQLPYHLDFLEKKGISLLALKRIKTAKKIFESVLAENPKRPIALCNLGYAYALEGDVKTAITFYNRAIALDPDYIQALINKVAILVYQEQIGDAKKILEQVLEKAPGHPQAQAALQQISGGS